MKKIEQYGRLEFVCSSSLHNFLCFCALLMKVMIGAFKNFPALASVAQWIEHWPEHWKILDSISSQGYVPGLQVQYPPRLEHLWEAAN